MDLKIVSASEFTLRKSFFERAVVTETWRDVSPFREERFVQSAARDVSADGHRSEGAAVIALAARKNCVAILLAIVKMKLPRMFDRSFGCFRAARSKIDSPAVAKIGRSHREQALGKFFRRLRVKLRSVRESDLGRLLRHRAPDFSNTVADADDRSLPGSIKESAAIVCDNPASFPASGDGKGLLEMAGEKSAARRHEISGRSEEHTSELQ